MNHHEQDALLDSLNVSANKCLLDKDLTFLYANNCFYKSTGYTKEEFQSLFSCFSGYYKSHPDEFRKIIEHAKSAIDKDICAFTVDLRMPHKEGGYRWFRMNGTITGETEDHIPVLCCINTDIHDIICEKEEKNQYFEWMLDEYVGNVYVSDMDTYELLYLNKTAIDTLMTPKNEMIGRKCYEVIQGRTAPCPFCTNHLLREDDVYEWKFDNPKLKRTFLIRNRQINWSGHRGRIELSHDMYSTVFKLSQKDRERDAIIRTSPGGFARVDARDMNTILWYGGGFLNMIGYTEEQFENELHRKCTYIHPDDIGKALDIMENARKTGQNTVSEGRVVTRNGKIKILTMTFSYVSAEESWDGIPSFYSMGLDVTEDRQEQERQHKALEDAYQTAKVASEAKTNFLSSMSHDIRTPMNAIMGMAAIAKMNLSSQEKTNDCLNKIQISGHHLLSLINEVLDMSKIESGKIDLIPEEVCLPDLVGNVSDMLKSLITQKNLEFKTSVCHVTHEKIITDGDRLQQVILNLLSNAIKYTPDGGTVSLRIQELPSSSEQKGQYEFIFTDNGIGMSKDYVDHIFEPFSRADDSRISKIQGTGLGMAITENIVRMMNGTIDVKTQLDKGSKFTVSVQFDLAGEEEYSGGELAGLPVLVVDDDQIVCESAAALLDELGMRGYWVLSGMEAVSCVEAAHKTGDDFFAVILDWKMPEMDGLDTVKALRKQLGGDVPIIIISAYDYSEIEDEFLKAGADAFLTKPLFKSKMLHVLQLFCTVPKTDACENSTESRPNPLMGKKVLLAEDNELNREIACELLTAYGLDVHTAENGQEAVDVFEASEPGFYDVVLMDIQMPVMDGYCAAETIRHSKHSDAHKIPILALTANAFTTDVGKAYSVGMNDHLTKPIDIEKLMEALERWID
ncbi:MAG: response regulator [Eubacteriales bacterium]|nr:response regulator [Eubacteriales bacterium]